MPPKLSKSAKQDLIVSHLRATRTCHTLKDLEKALPSVASINGIQVKEYIQALTDESQIRVEKIGSGNWYWCFGSDEKKARETRLTQLQKEVEKAQAGYNEVGSNLALQEAKREEEGESNADDDGIEREELLRRKHELEKKVQKAQAEWKAATDDTGNTSLLAKKV
ncbi:Meiotic nuclear division protein 1, partial [Elasticomyces elasticus]